MRRAGPRCGPGVAFERGSQLLGFGCVAALSDNHGEAVDAVSVCGQMNRMAFDQRLRDQVRMTAMGIWAKSKDGPQRVAPALEALRLAGLRYAVNPFPGGASRSDTGAGAASARIARHEAALGMTVVFATSTKARSRHCVTVRTAGARWDVVCDVRHPDAAGARRLLPTGMFGRCGVVTMPASNSRRPVGHAVANWRRVVEHLKVRRLGVRALLPKMMATTSMLGVEPVVGRRVWRYRCRGPHHEQPRVLDPNRSAYTESRRPGTTTTFTLQAVLPGRWYQIFASAGASTGWRRRVRRRRFGHDACQGRADGFRWRPPRRF